MEGVRYKNYKKSFRHLVRQVEVDAAARNDRRPGGPGGPGGHPQAIPPPEVGLRKEPHRDGAPGQPRQESVGPNQHLVDAVGSNHLRRIRAVAISVSVKSGSADSLLERSQLVHKVKTILKHGADVIKNF